MAFMRGIHWAGEFPAHMASNAENVPIWWRHHEIQWKAGYITPVRSVLLDKICGL